MRIQHLEIHNFKKFKTWSTELDPQFTLFVGNNGSGKTTILDALAVAAGIWLGECPERSVKFNNGSGIYQNEIRTIPRTDGDRLLFSKAWEGASIKAKGTIHDVGVEWKRQILPGGKRTTNADAKKALNVIKNLYNRDALAEKIVFPILAYYGAGRAWLPTRKRGDRTPSDSPGTINRWAAFYACLSESIRISEINDWFVGEAIATGNRGKPRPGYDIVSQAIIRCFPGAQKITFNEDRRECVLHLDNGEQQPFSYLSAGQRMMLYMVADIAIKAVTQNNHLVPADALQPEDFPWPRVLTQTPGIILIDELEVHLHPGWQRRVYEDLIHTFPALQFVCATHSPQIIGEVPTKCLRVIGDTSAGTPEFAFGLDSNRVLEVVMETRSQNEETQGKLDAISSLLDDGKLAEAQAAVENLKTRLGESHPELIRLNTLISLLKP